MSHIEMTKTTSSTTGQTHDADCSRRGRAALWLVALGVILLAGQLTLHLPVNLGAAAPFVPLLGAVAFAVHTTLRYGRPSLGSLWLLFAAAFPTLLGINEVTGATINLDWVPAIGFIVIGALVATGVVTPRRRRLRRSARS